MKKNIIISMLTVFASLFVASCTSDETEGLTFVENYPVIVDANGSLIQGSTVQLALGETYDYTFSAKCGDADVTKDIKVNIYDVIQGEYVQSIDTNNPGVYSVYYTGATEHKYASWTAERTVYVYDASITANISGTYGCDYDKSLYLSAGDDVTFSDMIADRGYPGNEASITISMLCPGIYQCSDFFGGWYEYVRGYAASYGNGRYNMSGIFLLNADNTVTMLTSKVNAWGDSLDYLEGGMYDPKTESLTYELGYAQAIYMAPYLYKK